MKNKIIFIHGFGVRKDARGMFTAIASKLPDFECILTDLNEVDEGGNTHLKPLRSQAEIIRNIYKKEREDSRIYLIAHSQGCVVSALADLPPVEKVFLLAPPTNNDLDKTINTFKNRPGTNIDLDGISTLMRRDGTKTFVPKEYWKERRLVNYLEEYERFSKSNNLVIILARQDEVVSNKNKQELQKLGQLIEIDGNHNFDETRVELIEIIKNNLSSKN